MLRRERATRHISKKLGPAGRLIAWSKSAYRKRHPTDVIVFNANICLRDGYKAWYGDINLTQDSETLSEIASFCKEPIYILREMDARFENEKNPNLDKAVTVIYPLEK